MHYEHVLWNRNHHFASRMWIFVKIWLSADVYGLIMYLDINECSSSPCENSATCVDQLDGYLCLCADGYSGTECAEDMDDCDPNPCMHAGICEDGVNNFICTCKLGYEGDHCGIGMYFDVIRRLPGTCKSVTEIGTHYWYDTDLGSQHTNPEFTLGKHGMLDRGLTLFKK